MFLPGDIHLHQFYYTRRKFIAPLNLFDIPLKPFIKVLKFLVIQPAYPPYFLVDLLVCNQVVVH